MRRKGSSRFVHDQDAHVERKRLRDLDRLLLGQRKTARWLSHVEPYAESPQDLLRFTFHSSAVNKVTPIVVTDEDILRHR